MNISPLTPGRRPGVRATGASLLALALAACTNPPSAPVSVPARLEPSAEESVAMTVAARGVQIYECRRNKDGSGYEWAFVAPDAELFDNSGRRIGSHGAGPSWQASDGSQVVGTLRERADAPITGAIPWLLLGAKSVGANGSFSKVTSIQRVNTAGGLAPRAGCSSDAAGRKARVPYTADYRLFRAG